MDTVTSIVLSASTKKDLVDALKTDDQAGKKWLKSADSLRADGVTYVMLGKDKEGGVPAVKNQVKAIIIGTFADTDQKLLATDTKVLDDMGKFQKRDLIQTIGKKMSKIVQHLKPKVERGPIIRMTLEDKLVETWANQLDLLSKSEEASFDVIAVRRILKELIDLIQ